MKKESGNSINRELIILIAPNVSEQMGGEAMKALQIFQEYRKQRTEVIQITHARNRTEIVDRLKLENVIFVNDNLLSLTIWRSYILRWLVDVWFSWAAVKAAETYVQQSKTQWDQVVIHQSEPNSPVVPRALSSKYKNVFGPINGNIYYPKLFRSKETLSAKIRRLLHMPLQYVNKILPYGIKRAELILVAGGTRSRDSLIAAGCKENSLFETVDCGIKDEILNRPRITHENANYKFVHFGRLVLHKGTFLAIRAVQKTKTNVTLDIIGTGPALEHCKQLSANLGLSDRVKFLDWYPSHRDLLDVLHQYRGFVLPSFEDANGIVVQEAMAVGLPPICLDWGGPQLLIRHSETGFLVVPGDEEQITGDIAKYMDSLASDPGLAEHFSKTGRAIAEEWRWSNTARHWIAESLKDGN
jgi:glycosyltransferase involved in cell wall biosynthesis